MIHCGRPCDQGGRCLASREEGQTYLQECQERIPKEDDAELTVDNELEFFCLHVAPPPGLSCTMASPSLPVSPPASPSGAHSAYRAISLKCTLEPSFLVQCSRLLLGA